MKTIKLKGFVLAMVAMGLVFTSCSKDEDDDNDINNGITGVDQAKIITDSETSMQMEQALSGIEDFVAEISEQEREKKQTTPRGKQLKKSNVLVCPTISLTPESTFFKGAITIDYGASCIYKGNTHKGSVVINYDYDATAGETTITYVLNEYYFNGIKIEVNTGEIVIDYVNANQNRERTHTFDIELTWPENVLTGTRKGSLVREWVVLDPLDKAVAEITGSWVDALADGAITRTHTIDSEDPLRFEVEHMEFVSGSMAIDHKGFRTYSGVLDFGNGIPDGESVFTLDNSDITITIKK